MTKILITGFRHSGTTMLHQLIKAHPQVGWIENEESFIEFDKSKEWMLLMASHKVQDLKKYAWGEKIPWGTRPVDYNGERAINMIKKWLKYFKGQGRVLHILRHPLDVALSGRGDSTKIGEKDWEYIMSSVPKVIDFVNSNKRCKTIIYEELLYEPEEVISEILDFLNLENTPKIVKRIATTPLKFGKINPERAYNFKNKQIETDFYYEDWLERVRNANT